MKFSPVDLQLTRQSSPHNALKTRRILRVLSLLLLAIVGFAGCATPAQPEADTTNTIVGNPPSPKEDPFFVRGNPANAERVEAQGRIEPVEPAEEAGEEAALEEMRAEEVTEESAPEEAQAEDVAEAPAPQPPPTPVEIAPEEPRDEVAARGDLNAITTPESAAPKPAKTEAVIPQTPAPAQCFSCVKICPVAGDCARADEDIICGWGTQKNLSEAKELARAQCDATLDLARQMPVWSRIDGDCPAATCR